MAENVITLSDTINDNKNLINKIYDFYLDLSDRAKDENERNLIQKNYFKYVENITSIKKIAKSTVGVDARIIASQRMNSILKEKYFELTGTDYDEEKLEAKVLAKKSK